MLVLLPPSETKRDGGIESSSLDLSSLHFPELTPQRKAALSALKTLSRNLAISTGALGLGPKQRFEIDRNRVVGTAPVMPAIERYTGALYDGLGAESLSPPARAWVEKHVLICSALFGLVGAGDHIPAYRLSHNSRLPALALKKHWRGPLSAVLERQPGLILDLRSESYAALGPLPQREDAVYVRVVTADEGGHARALNHFNKKGKGTFVRALANAGVDHPDVSSLLAWADEAGIRLERSSPGELRLFV
jgi:cytoplasmic iron level regulating protein YaaA (DUF328/UPF0246 family)